MNGSRNREVLDRHAGVGQFAGVVVALVRRGIVLGGGDDGGGKSGQFFGARRRDPRVGAMIT